MQMLLTFFSAKKNKKKKKKKNINAFAIFQDRNFNVTLAKNFVKSFEQLSPGMYIQFSLLANTIFEEGLEVINLPMLKGHKCTFKGDNCQIILVSLLKRGLF